MKKRSPLLLAFLPLALASLGCSPGGTGVASDAGSSDAGPDADAGAGDAGTEGDAGPELELGELLIDGEVSGVISAPNEQDAYRVATTAGRYYRVHLNVPVGSVLAPHLTVLDSGRDDDNPGGDYVQLSKSSAESHVNLEFVASGDGHIIVVRDLRNLPGGTGSGSPDHAYELWIEELELTEVSEGDLSFPSTFEGELDHAGAIAVYRFEAEQWADALFELTADGDMDGRMWVIAESTGTWIARNDDQASSLNPLIDAPLTEGGVLWLVVDNVDPQSSNQRYSLTVDLP